METVAEHKLKAKWEALTKEQPHLRIRNAAQVLGVSELELLVTKIGHGVTTLKPEFQNILGELEPLGKVMALTRNNEVVHERKGVYLNPELNNPHVGLFVGEDIDLRIFFSCWGYAFAVDEESRKSLQFFAKNGEAVHKIYLTNKSNEVAFQQLVEKYKAEEQNLVSVITPTPEKEAEQPDTAIDINGFQEAWVNLKDTHHFFGMLKKYGVTRTQALRIAPQGNYAVKVDNLACRNLLELAAKEGVEIMVFVGNPGMIQIHTGPVKKVLEAKGWYNVLDPDFNLHIKEAEITDSWVVRKPTEDDVVTALECFNKDGEQIVQLFGKRKPGIPELTSWRDIVANVEQSLKLN